MPVVFVLFKGAVAETRTWVAKLRSWTARSKMDLEMQSYSEVDKIHPPSTPGGTISGVKTCVQGAHHWSPGNTHETLIQTTHGQVLTYVSAEYDYHTHLRHPDTQNQSDSSKSWQLTRTYDSIDGTRDTAMS